MPKARLRCRYIYITSIANPVPFHQSGNFALPDGPHPQWVQLKWLRFAISDLGGHDGFDHRARSAHGRYPVIHDGLGMSPASIIYRCPAKTPLTLRCPCRADVKAEATVIYQRLAHQVPSHPEDLICVAGKRPGLILPRLYSLRRTTLIVIPSRGEFWASCHDWIGVLGCAGKRIGRILPHLHSLRRISLNVILGRGDFLGARGPCHDWYSQTFVVDGSIHWLGSTGRGE